ncbi:MAG: hypothetical protein D6782_10445 [Alphaproteobacteria bacterium]|nr:MAG: hypothetical protein D6782_10445 [Alphaproteobacteria bacterium]
MKFAVIDQTDAKPAPREGLMAVDLILHDGTRLHGGLAVPAGADALALLNDAAAFFALYVDNGERLLIAKAAVAVCRAGAGDS